MSTSELERNSDIRNAILNYGVVCSRFLWLLVVCGNHNLSGRQFRDVLTLEVFEQARETSGFDLPAPLRLSA